MANSDKKVPTAPSQAAAAVMSHCDEFASRAPPPTYEESQRMPGDAPTRSQLPPQYTVAPSNQYYGMTHHQQLPLAAQMYGYGPMQQQSPQQQHNFGAYNNPNAPSTSAAVQPQVLHLDARAEIRTTATGAVIVPPPPPGCAPTPAQLAAMRGQPVVLKQKKRSLF